MTTYDIFSLPGMRMAKGTLAAHSEIAEFCESSVYLEAVNIASDKKVYKVFVQCAIRISLYYFSLCNSVVLRVSLCKFSLLHRATLRQLHRENHHLIIYKLRNKSNLVIHLDVI